MRLPVLSNFGVLRYVLVTGAFLLFSSCGGGDKGTEPLVVGSVSVAPSNPSAMFAGGTLQLTATVKSTTGQVMTGQTVTFSSSATGIATVSNTGLVTSVGPVGNATITVSVGGKQTTVEVSVTAGAAAALTRTSPDPTNVAPGTTAGDSVRFLVTDAFGNPRAQQTVNFAVTAGGGQASPASAQTDAQGRVATVFVTGTTPGSNTLSAALPGGSPVVLTLTTVAGSVTVTSISPSPMRPAAQVTITGSGFSSAVSGNTVTIDGVTAPISSAAADQLVISVPTTLPCTPTHQATVQVNASGSSAIGRQTLTVGVAQSPTVGGSVTVSGATCVELSPATGHFAVNVVNTGDVPTGTAPFRFSGATSIPPGATFSPRPTFTLRQVPQRIARSIRLPFAQDGQLPRTSAHTLELERNREIVRQLRKTFRRGQARGPVATARGSASASISAAAVPAVGETRNFRVVQISTALGAGATCTNFVEITAKVVYVGTKAIVYEDVANPLAGQMDSYFVSIGQEFDATMYPSDAKYFGDPLITDQFTDNDQHLNMVFTKATSPGLSGFVISCDFFPRNTTNNTASNLGENFYARVPSVAGSGFTSNTPDGWLRTMRSTIVHEVKHIAAVGFRIVNDAPFEESWLEEGMAMVAEETWGRDNIYGGAWKGNMTYASTVFCDVRPSSAACDTPPVVMFDHFANLYDVLQATGSTSLFGRVADNDFAFYYASWSFIRYNADRYAGSEQDFLRSITQSVDVTGIDNMARATHASANEMLGGWSLALLLDENPAMSTNAAANFPSWHLRDIYASLSNDFHNNSPNPFPLTFPLQPQVVNAGDFAIDNTGIHGGSFVSFDLPAVSGSTRTLSLTGSPSLLLVIARTQ